MKTKKINIIDYIFLASLLISSVIVFLNMSYFVKYNKLNILLTIISLIGVVISGLLLIKILGTKK